MLDEDSACQGALAICRSDFRFANGPIVSSSYVQGVVQCGH